MKEEKRRDSQKSDSGRNERVVGNIIDLHAGKIGADQGGGGSARIKTEIWASSSDQFHYFMNHYNHYKHYILNYVLF